MDLQAFCRNFAKSFCRTAVDRLKYLYWIYSSSLPSMFRRKLTLRLTLDPPVGAVVLSVRCNGGSDAFIFSEVFEHGYYNFELPERPATVLDLGSNIGLTALFFARKYPGVKVACVEPMPDNLALLRANLERNGVPAKIVGKAISVDDQPVTMEIAPNDYGHKVSNMGYGLEFRGQTLTVDGISVPTLLNELGWERVGLLKIDIEGYEGVLLRERCEWMERVDAMCIECHQGYGEADLVTLAKRFGFSPPRALEGTILLTREPQPAARN